jgi:hypothetical protein
MTTVAAGLREKLAHLTKPLSNKNRNNQNLEGDRIDAQIKITE